MTALANITGQSKEQITQHLEKTKSIAKAFVHFLKRTTVDLVDINYALDDLYNITEQTQFENALADIIKHLNADDMELFIRLYLKEELLYTTLPKILYDFT